MAKPKLQQVCGREVNTAVRQAGRQWALLALSRSIPPVGPLVPCNRFYRLQS